MGALWSVLTFLVLRGLVLCFLTLKLLWSQRGTGGGPVGGAPHCAPLSLVPGSPASLSSLSFIYGFPIWYMLWCYLLISYLGICCGADMEAQVFSCPMNTASQTQIILLGGKYSYLLVHFACVSPVFSGLLVSFPHSKMLYVNQAHL